MKTKILFIVFCITSLTLTGFAQSAQPTPSATQAPALSAKAKALCKEWTLVKTEVFGVESEPKSDQKSDRLILLEGGRYRLIYNGTAEGGTWTIDKSNTWITMTSDNGAIKKFRILQSSDKTLKIDYKDSDDVHNTLFYEVK
ncbi:MAG: hypothetical protein Fur0041_00890 [Bacteroidia bacterium]